MHGESGYGLWTLVILNSTVFIFFAFSFVKPKTKADWRSVHQQFDAQQQKTAVSIDDVISSGQTILQCIAALKAKGFNKIQCAAVHGIFADGVDAQLLAAGLEDLVTTNTIAHRSNAIDISELLVPPITQFLQDLESLD